MTGERGFTLIETLVSFAILAVVLVALYEAMGTSLNGFDRAAQADEALLVAQSEFDRLAAMKTLPAGGVQGEVAGTAYRWRAVILPSSGAEPEHLRASAVKLTTVRLVVSWRDGARTRQIAIDKTLLLPRGTEG